MSAATWTTEQRDPFQTPAGVKFSFLQLPRQDVVLMKGFLNKDVFEACHITVELEVCEVLYVNSAFTRTHRWHFNKQLQDKQDQS